jgi:hypothetical protein
MTSAWPLAGWLTVDVQCSVLVSGTAVVDVEETAEPSKSQAATPERTAAAATSLAPETQRAREAELPKAAVSAKAVEEDSAPTRPDVIVEDADSAAGGTGFTGFKMPSGPEISRAMNDPKVRSCRAVRPTGGHTQCGEQSRPRR